MIQLIFFSVRFSSSNLVRYTQPIIRRLTTLSGTKSEGGGKLAGGARGLEDKKVIQSTTSIDKNTSSLGCLGSCCLPPSGFLSIFKLHLAVSSDLDLDVEIQVKSRRFRKQLLPESPQAKRSLKLAEASINTSLQSLL